MPSEYENSRSKNRGYKNKMTNFLKNGSKIFYYISVIYGDHLLNKTAQAVLAGK
jgi:hypothetical protein